MAETLTDFKVGEFFLINERDQQEVAIFYSNGYNEGLHMVAPWGMSNKLVSDYAEKVLHSLSRDNVIDKFRQAYVDESQKQSSLEPSFKNFIDESYLFHQKNVLEHLKKASNLEDNVAAVKEELNFSSKNHIVFLRDYSGNGNHNHIGLLADNSVTPDVAISYAKMMLSSDESFEGYVDGSSYLSSSDDDLKKVGFYVYPIFDDQKRAIDFIKNNKHYELNISGKKVNF